MNQTLDGGLSVNEFVQIGLDALEEEKLKEKRFAAGINTSIESIEAGRYEDFTSIDELDGYMQKVADEVTSSKTKE